jgi:hypothetical protein
VTVISALRFQQALLEKEISHEAFEDRFIAKAVSKFLFLRSLLDAMREAQAEPEKK